jgi:hypothetical protein
LVGWLSFDVKRFWALRDNIYDVCVVITLAMAMLLRDFGPYIYDVCIIITVAMVMLLGDSGPYGIMG